MNNCVSQVPIFNHLTRDEMNEVSELIYHRTYKQGEYLFMAGDTNDSLFVLRQGEVRVYRLNDNGDEQILRVLKQGDFTGEYALFGRSGKYASYAEIMKDAKICTIKKADLESIIVKYPRIGLKFIESFVERLNHSENQTASASMMSAKDRLFDYLKNINHHSYVTLPMTKKHIASFLSMQPETLNRMFNTLESEGFIKKLNHREYKILKKE